MVRFALLLLLCFQDGFTVTVEPAFTVDVVTPAIVTEKPVETKTVETQRVQADAGHRQWFLVSESWCHNCPRAKARFLAKGWSTENVLTIKQCQQRFGFRVPYVPYEFADPSVSTTVKSIQPAEPVQFAEPVRPMPERYIQWPGWGMIDLETYNRNCNCSMCQSIRAHQHEYRRRLEAFRQPQTSVTPDQEGTPHALVETMLDSMDLRSGDILGDLGCGDGRILIAAGRRGIKGIGVEIDPGRAAVARSNVTAAGLEHLITIETGDVLEFDTSRVTAVTTFLYPPLLAKLSHKLKSVRIVASPFHEVPGLPMKQIGDVWLYTSATARSPPGNVITVTPDGGNTTTQLRRTQNATRFQFVP